jgi:hypothetical protein
MGGDIGPAAGACPAAAAERRGASDHGRVTAQSPAAGLVNRSTASFNLKKPGATGGTANQGFFTNCRDPHKVARARVRSA